MKFCIIVLQHAHWAPRWHSPTALVKAVKGHVPELLRHPCGATILEELYNIASAAQRDTLAAEFYGKEYVLFGPAQVGAPGGGQGVLTRLLAAAEPLKRKTILRVRACYTFCSCLRHLSSATPDQLFFF